MKEIYYDCSLDFLGVHYHISEIAEKLYKFISQLTEENNGEIKLYSEKYECYFLNKKIHRDNAPAFIRKDLHNSYTYWFQEGKRHRDDGPAYEFYDDKIWFKNDKPHRDYGPAVISPESIEWFSNGAYHRNDGPAILHVRKFEDISKKSKTPLILNRGDDIAYIMIGGVKNEIKVKTIEGVKYLVHGEEWWKNGKRHREDEPAVVNNYKISSYLTNLIFNLDEPIRNDDGIFKQWYNNGELHRTEGPAEIFPDGEMWYINGKLHRVDGPAVIRKNEKEEWWINGRKKQKI